MDHTLPRLKRRLLFGYHRLALSWQARRNGRGRAITLRPDGDLVRLNDGARDILIPHVGNAADFSGGIEARLEAVAEKYLGGSGYAPRAGDVVVDVGAGVGEFAMWCAARGAGIVAFEPDPLAHACLLRNTLALEGVEIHSHALWKERVDLRLHASIDTRESSLIKDGRATDRSVDVEAWPLDQLQFMAQLPVIDLMKVDGEGVEPEILIGAARTLRRTRVLAVDIGATSRRPNLRSRVESVLELAAFRPLPGDRTESILALNTAMVGPFNSRVSDRQDD